MANYNNNTPQSSNSGLYFIIGAVVVAIAAIMWYLSGGEVPTATTAPAGDTNVTVTTPPATETAPVVVETAPAGQAPAATQEAPAGMSGMSGMDGMSGMSGMAAPSN